MLFGKYAVVDNVRHCFEQEPDWFWEFRPASVADELDVQRWLQKESKKDLKPGWLDMAVKQIALCSVRTNIPGAGLDEGGKLTQFEELLNQMPMDMLSELWVALGEVNPLWGPPRPQKSDPETTEDASVAVTS